MNYYKLGTLKSMNMIYIYLHLCNTLKYNLGKLMENTKSMKVKALYNENMYLHPNNTLTDTGNTQ